MSALQPDWLEWQYDGHRHFIVQRPEISFVDWIEAQDYCDEHNRALVGQAVIRERNKIAAWLRKFNYQQIADAIEAGEHLK